ncbi:MAG TPA: Crp/Fnr family transcriptional regulator [Gemmatimonadales bacterium]|nr:Crp/Fnr family transcriptional regulator [Gemmatimonadales bacterium]
MTDVVALLRAVPIFTDLDQRTLATLSARCVPRTVGAGFTLFRAGDRCNGLYVVVEGRVRVYRSSPDGREQTLAVEGPGRPVAELPLVDGGDYPASAVTATPARLIFLPRAEFVQAFRNDPEVAAAVVASLGRRLRHLVQLVETVAFRDVAARLAMWLADAADRPGQVGADQATLTLERTQDELATELGTARESVSRAFKQLSSTGLIRSRKGRKLVVAHPDRLRAWARGSGR